MCTIQGAVPGPKNNPLYYLYYVCALFYLFDLCTTMCTICTFQGAVPDP